MHAGTEKEWSVKKCVRRLIKDADKQKLRKNELVANLCHKCPHLKHAVELKVKQLVKKSVLISDGKWIKLPAR